MHVDPNLPDASPDVRRAMYEQMVGALAQLHNAPVRELGLQHFGNPEVCKKSISIGVCERLKIGIWSDTPCCSCTL